MEAVEHTIIQYAHGERWPNNLVDVTEAAANLGIPVDRLLSFTRAGYAPHWRIDGGEPLYRLADLRSWGARNITAYCGGKPLPVRLTVNVEREPCNTAPAAIRDIPELVELPISGVSGVYFLVKGDQVVYVGQSISPLSRIGTHGGTQWKDFDRAYVFPVPEELLNAVEGALIRWLKPPLNGGENPRAPRQKRDDVEVLEKVLGCTPEYLATHGVAA